jgi:hypothetical protein
MRLLLTVQPDLTVQHVHTGLQVHAIARGRVWASRGYALLCADLHEPRLRWHPAGQVPMPLWRRGAAWSDLLGQALRLGVHGLLPLHSGALLASVSGRLLRSDDGHQWEPVLHYEGFRKPTRHGLAADSQGRGWLAQYSLNPDRNQRILLWRSEDDGRTFREAHAFAPGQVRHIHFLQQDPHDGSLWMGTGDADRESALYRSVDGEHWDVVGAGSQQWRAIALAFREDAVVWGTDAGLDAPDYANRILRFDRATGQAEALQRVQGPVHGITSLPDGGILLATGVEGGRNEIDRRVHLWHSRDGRDFREVAHFLRGVQPRRVQYAVCHFAAGQQESDRVFLILRGLLAAPLVSLEVAL